MLMKRMQIQKHMVMKHECSRVEKQHSKSLGTRIRGGGSGGQHRCGRSLGNALCLGYVFLESFSTLCVHYLRCFGGPSLQLWSTYVSCNPQYTV